MDQVRRTRLRLVLAGVVGVALLAAALLLGGRDDNTASDPTRTNPEAVTPPADPSSPPATSSPQSTLRVWSRPTTRDASTFAEAYATAIWTYDTHLPYAAWAEAIGSWADPLGSPASARVAMSMLPPPPTYQGLRAQSARSTATIESVVVPQQATRLRTRAPAGWQVFVVRGTQHVATATGSYRAARQATVAVLCDSTCWLYSTTPELPQ